MDEIVTEKRCPGCGEIKSLEEYHRDRGLRDGRARLCRTCACEKQKAWRLKNPEPGRASARKWKAANKERADANHREWLKNNRDRVNEYNRIWWAEHPETARRQTLRKRGMTAEQFADKMDEQGGVCAICGAYPPTGRAFAIDHDHKSGEVRGLLCSSCNTALGLFKDNAENLLSAIQYLEKYVQRMG